jgi:hypothetical protein
MGPVVQLARLVRKVLTYLIFLNSHDLPSCVHVCILLIIIIIISFIHFSSTLQFISTSQKELITFKKWIEKWIRVNLLNWELFQVPLFRKKTIFEKNCLDTTRRSKIRIIPVQSEGKFPYTQRGVPITSYWEKFKKSLILFNGYKCNNFYPYTGKHI